jgi:hypothetical protein
MKLKHSMLDVILVKQKTLLYGEKFFSLPKVNTSIKNTMQAHSFIENSIAL